MHEPRPTAEDDPAEPDDDATSLVTRFGTVVGAGVVAALVASIPAALRVGGGSFAHALERWIALTALLLPLAIVCVAVLRRARVGMRILFGGHLTVVAAGAVWWAVLELAVLSVAGAVLRAKTHHHGLAGVTFAVFAVVSGIVVALFAARGGRVLSRFSETAQRTALFVALAAALVAVVLALLRTSKAPELGMTAALIDVMALAAATGIASSAALARVRPLALAGVPIAAVVVVLGLSSVRGQPGIGEAVARRAPVHSWLLATVGKTDDAP